MCAALRDLLEVQLPCEQLTCAASSDHNALRAANNCVKFLVPHSWSVIIWGESCREDVDLFLGALLRLCVARSYIWPSSTAPPHCEVFVLSLAAPGVLTLATVLVAQL